MRLAMVMGLLLSILLIWPAYNQVLDEERPISQLDPTSLSYCELETCGYIEELGIEVLAPAEIREGAYGTEVWVQVVNKDRMSGTRQIWAELRSPEGKLVEGANTIADFTGANAIQYPAVLATMSADQRATLMDQIAQTIVLIRAGLQ